MTDDREKISTGPNAEPLNDTVAGTGPGIPDDARERIFDRFYRADMSELGRGLGLSIAKGGVEACGGS